MKIAITGHTRGIGKSLFDELTSSGHDVSGFSRTNGYDIADKYHCDRLLDEIRNYDVFVNNAFDYFGQTYILESILNLWKDADKIIINVNSKSVYSKKIPDIMIKYVEEKNKQIDICRNRKLKAKPHLVNLTLGLVDTEMSKNFIAKKLNPNSVAKLVSKILEIKDEVYVQELTLDVPFQDWDNIRSVN
jgi:NADP-dependent 3-hydroxy acid dehydrogenase YdfG